MRKITMTENLSLDGIMEAPEKWAFSYQGDDIAEFNKAGMLASDALLLGRVTYEEFAAYWPKQTNDESGITDYLNKTAKFVVSSTLKKTEWKNSTIVNGNLVEEITKLKQQPGKDISVIGSATLVQSLMQADLIDEYHLFVVPIVLGKGKRLFKDSNDRTALKLVETKAFSAGVVLLTYQPSEKQSST
jgi:dihydrofolate reductase